MVAHKKGAAAMGGDNRKSGGVKERLRQTTAVRRDETLKKRKEGFPKMHHVILFWELCKYIYNIWGFWVVTYWQN